jgi:hypothetical protein
MLNTPDDFALKGNGMDLEKFIFGWVFIVFIEERFEKISL